MSPRLRIPLIIIGVITVFVMAIFVVPRGLSLYYQIRGGQHIDYVLRFEEGIQELVCEPLSPSNEEARKEVENGIDDLNRAIRLNKNNAQAYYYLGKAYCLLGEPEEAKENYLQYMELRPENPLGHIGLGFAYERLGKTNSALDAWKEGGLGINDFLDVGGQALQTEQYGDALQWYQRAIDLDPFLGSPWYHIGLIREEFGDLVSAESAYLESTELSPEFVDAYYALGDLYSLKLDDYNRAIQFYEKAAKLEDLPIKAYLGIGKSAEEINDDDKALDAYINAEELSRLVFGDTYNQVWLRVWPKYILGDFYLRKGDLEKAKQLFQDALEADEYQYYTVFSLWGGGRAALLSDDLDTAMDMLNRALDYESNYYIHSQINLAIGQVFIKQGDLEAGIEYIVKAHNEHPDNQGLHHYLAELLISGGKYQEAISEYEKILEKWSNDSRAESALEVLQEDGK